MITNQQGEKTTATRLAKELTSYWAGMAADAWTEDDTCGLGKMTERERELVQIQMDKIYMRVYRLLK